MKKLLIITVCIASFATGSVFAGEEQKRHGGDREARKERMKEHLDLSDEQLAQMREIRQSGGSREDIRGVLTEDQRQKWDESREKHRQHKHEDPSE